MSDIENIQFDVQSMLDESRSQVVAAIVDDARRRLSWTVGEQIAEQVKPVVKQFVADEILPELRAQLVEQKGVILEAAVQAAIVIGESVAKSLIAQATQSANDSYRRSKIMDAIFGR